MSDENRGMEKSERNSVSRRLFFRDATVGAAALAGVPRISVLQPVAPSRIDSRQRQMMAAIQGHPIPDGKSPLPPIDSAAFNGIVKSADTISMAVQAGGKAPIPFPTEFLPIDTNVHTDPDFGLDVISSAGAQFRFWQLESLLDQAADLLDRCARERTDYDQLRAQWAKLFLEVTEFEQLEAIHEDEIAHGWYTVVHDQSSADLAALKELIKPVSGNIGWPNVDQNQGYLATSAIAKAGFNALRSTPQLGSLHEEAGHLGTEGTINEGRIVDELGFKIQEFDLAAQAASTNALISGRQAKESFDNADIDFRRRRSTSAVVTNELKKKLMSDPGGPYNYIEQGKPIRKRFMRDFRDAYLRLLAANDGLKKILDLTVPIPDFPFVTPQTGASGIFDRALLWNREAIRMLIALGQSDQGYVLSLSLKTLLGRTWNSQIAAGGSPISFSFDFPATRLQGQRLTRLRGVSAFVVKKSGANGVWHLTVRPPKSAVGPDGPGASPLIQNVPTVHLGSVDIRNSQQPAETVGTVVLRNVSLVGHPSAAAEDRMWKVEADPLSSTGDHFSDAVDDIEIEFRIVTQAM